MRLREWFDLKAWLQAARIVLSRPANPTKGYMLLLHTYIMLILIFLFIREVWG